MNILVEDMPQEQNASPAIQNDEVAHLILASHFDIDTPTKEEGSKLQEIWRHGVKLSPTGDVQDIIWQVIHLRRSLGAPKLGESPLDKVYRWAKLKRQAENIEMELMDV